MTTVLVQTPGTRISARGGKLLLETATAQQEIPLGHVTELVIVGNARVSTAVITDLAGRGVPIHIQGTPHQLPISIHTPLGGQIAALQTQFMAPSEQKLQAAKVLVAGKIKNSNWLLQRTGHRTRLEIHAVAQATTAEQLRGIEGHAARMYFSALGELLSGWAFSQRAYRPAPDPVNAALSFAYTLLLGRAVQAINRAGLHPALGTLHVTHGQRPALALDVMEPFRAPVCDLTVLSLLRSGQLPRDQFEQFGPEVRLGKAGCSRLAKAVAERIQDWQIDAALNQQVRSVQRIWQQETEAGAAWEPPVRA